MKLTQIALRNFRSGQNLVLDTDAPRIYICGDNGVGKSSIREAIRWTLRGVCQATDAKGLGWQAIVPEGTTVLSAGVVLDGIGSVERAYKDGKRTLQLEGRDNDIGSTQHAVYELLQTSPEFLDAVLETDYFIRLGHADAKAMVLGLLNVRIPVAGEETLTLAQVESRYQDAFKARTEAKARLKGHLVPTAPVGDAYDIAEIDARIKELQGELDGLLSQGGQMKGKRQSLEHQLNMAQSRSVQEVSEDPSETIERMRAELLQWNIAMGTYRAARDAATSAVGTLVPVNSNASLIEQLSKHQPTKGCVLDPNVPCDTHKNKFTNRVKFLKSQETMEKPAETPEVEEHPYVKVDPFLGSSLEKGLDALQARKNQRELAILANAQRESDIDALQAQLNSLPPEVAVDNGAAVEALRARIEKGQKVRDKAKEYWDAKARYDKAVETKVRLEAEVSRLEVLCEVLGPNGVRVQALKTAIDQFESAINQRTKAFGWTVKFDLEPWTVLVNGRPVDAYSESEQFRIGLAIQMAVAEASGLGFLVVDRLDMLLVANRKIVNQMLLKPNPAIQQIIILASREPEDPLPHAEGVKAFRLSLNDHNRTVIAETT